MKRLWALAAFVALTAEGPAGPAAASHHVISCENPAAQAAFDRGLAFAYAFSIGEARLQFAAAAAAAPACAIARWGEALTDTFDINLPQTPEGDRRGAAALAEATARRAGASAEEAALIDALAARFTRRGTVDGRFRAYAAAMDRVAAAYPNDADVLTIAAYARWNALDDFLDTAGVPTAPALAMERDIDAALVLDPGNIGAHHLRIHAEEELGRPAAALSDARTFDGLSFPLGMSHLPHMAGHTYARVGDYPALVAANQRAVANDAAYFALGDGAGQQYMRAYHDHDLDFIAYGLTTMGRNAEARAAVAHEDDRMQLRVALRTRDPETLALAVKVKSDVARAIALARAGKTAEAQALVDAFPGGGPSYERIPRLSAAAIVLRAEGRLTEAAALFREAVALRGRELGDPKVAWQIPPGEGLGAVLLVLGDEAAAETVFRNELTAYPNDPRLAYGLAEALQRQGKDDSAARAIVMRTWHGTAPLTEDDLE